MDIDLQPNDLRYTLIIDGKEYVLPQSPQGWEDNTIRWERSQTYNGVIRNFSIPIQFVLDGAWLLRRQLYTNKTVESQAILRIEILDRSSLSNAWSYYLLYEGDIDYSTIEDTLTSVEVNLMERGLSARIKAYENVQYEIDLNVPEAIEINIPGIDKTGNASFITFNPLTSNNHILRLNIAVDNTESTYISLQDVEYFSSPNPINFTGRTDWFIRANHDLTFTLSFSLNMEVSISIFDNPNPFNIKIMDDNNNVIRDYPIYVDVSNQMVNITLSDEINTTLLTGSSWFFYVENNGPFDLGNIIIVDEGQINVSYALTTPPSLSKALRPKYVFDKLIEKMNGAPVTTRSSLLDGFWRKLTITSGDGIREIQDAKIITSFSDFYKSINAVLSVGFGIENGVPTLESKSYWFKSNLQIANLGSIKDFRLEPATEYMYNTIRVGYQKYEYEVENGREEYNNGQMYSTPITRVQKELDLRSVYRADQYGIESVRLDRENLNNENQDTKSDNDTFFIVVQDNPIAGNTYNVEGYEHYTQVSGITTRTSAYNLSITPKNNLYRHGPYLRSILTGLEGSSITFESADKNKDLVTIDLNGRRVAESSNIPIAALGTPIFLPYIVTFNTRLIKRIQQYFDTNPTGYITFTYRDEQYMGFIMETSFNPVINAQQEFKLLLSPLTNLLNLIH